MSIHVYHNIRFLDYPHHPTIRTSDLYLTAVIQTDIPQQAYELTQHLERPWEENPLVRVIVPSRSTAVGDVLRLENGRLLLVAPLGFEPVPDLTPPLPDLTPADYQTHTLRFLLPLLDYLVDTQVLAGKPDGHRWGAVAKYGRLQTVAALSDIIAFQPFPGKLPPRFKDAARLLIRPYQAISQELYEQLVGILETADSDFFLYNGQIVTIGTADGGFAVMPLCQEEQTRLKRLAHSQTPPEEVR